MTIQTLKEEVLHYVWRTKSFDFNNLKTTAGKDIDILYEGQLNADAGPDFLQAKIKIGNTLWIGQVEMHIKASDWSLHSHHIDPAYQNVILHVVYINDKEVFKKNGDKIPTLEMFGRINPQVLNRYGQLKKMRGGVPCQNIISTKELEGFELWKYRLVGERLSRKAKQIKKRWLEYKKDWDRTFYWSLSRYFGVKVNIVPFEILADSLDLNIIMKNGNSLLKIEALLFGQAGMLRQENIEDNYYTSLRLEYLFLKKKYKLTPIETVLWKFARLRPRSFPTIRLAQLSSLLFKETRMLSKILETEDVQKVRNFFDSRPSSYWHNHYRFFRSSVTKEKKMTKNFIDLIIINVICPILFLYGQETNDHIFVDRSIDFLEALRPESNNIVKTWETMGLESRTALDSQSVIELKRNYCDKQECLKCSIGHQLLKGKK